MCYSALRIEANSVSEFPDHCKITYKKLAFTTNTHVYTVYTFPNEIKAKRKTENQFQFSKQQFQSNVWAQTSSDHSTGIISLRVRYVKLQSYFGGYFNERYLVKYFSLF